MLAKVLTYGINGLDAYPLTIEVDVSHGLPGTFIVGLPDNAVKESKERVRSAIKNSGYKFPFDRITVNLSPADIKKEGPSFDLAIALGILAASSQIALDQLNQFAFLGELSLDGHIRSIHGSLSIALSTYKHKLKGLILPDSNAHEAAIAQCVPIFPFKNLNEVIYFLNDTAEQKPFTMPSYKIEHKSKTCELDFSDIKGQAHVKRGIEVAVAGGHNVL